MSFEGTQLSPLQVFRNRGTGLQYGHLSPGRTPSSRDPCPVGVGLRPLAPHYQGPRSLHLPAARGAPGSGSPLHTGLCDPTDDHATVLLPSLRTSILPNIWGYRWRRFKCIFSQFWRKLGRSSPEGNRVRTWTENSHLQTRKGPRRDRPCQHLSQASGPRSVALPAS